MTNTGMVPHLGQSQVPTNLGNVVAVAAGVYHSLALVDGDPKAIQIIPSSMIRSGSTIALKVLTESGHVYRLEYKDSLVSPDWVALPLVPGNGGMQTLQDTNATSGQRFYRVRRW